MSARRIAVALAIASAARAQAVHSPAAAQLDSLVAAGDSSGALKLTDQLLRADPKNAEVFYRRGMLAWGMSRSERRVGFIRDQNVIDLLRVADSSLRIATMYAPDSGRYWMELGRFFLNSNLATLRFQAASIFGKAVDAARRSGDSALVAETADEAGMVYWRRYEAVADRRNLRQNQQVDLSIYRNDPKALNNFLETMVWQPTVFSGEGDYLKSSDYFAEALRADPNNPRALRHAMMALADRKRWEELKQLSQRRLDIAPWDPNAWLGRGLAAHRLNDDRDATIAFDSALAFLSPRDRARFTRLSRILRPEGGSRAKQDSNRFSDSARYEGLPAAERARLERYYWMLSDPLTLTPGNEHWIEFLARVAYSEFMWTSDDFDLKGADTDRGDVHIRYGPPQTVIGFQPNGRGINETMWLYSDGLNFVFRAPPTWGTASLTQSWLEVVEEWKKRSPVQWNNVDHNIDSISLQVARFRADADSGDIFVVAELPIDSLVKGLDLARAPIDIDLKVYEANAELSIRDSTREMVTIGQSQPARVRAWRERLARGTHVYRVEALQPDNVHGARGLGSFELESDAGGFAISDVLVADNIAPRGDAASATRWRDFNIVPSVGRFRRGQSMSLLWETYGLAAQDGSNKYRIAITLDKVQRKGAGAFVARIIGGAAEALGVNARGKGKVTLTFARQAPAIPVSVDHYALDLGGAPPGEYTLLVEVTDLVTSKKVTRKTTITVVE